jgi:hypothetical protein
MIKKILVIATVSLIIIGLSGCVSLDELKEKILGKWLVGDIPEGEDDSVVFHFFSNGSFYVNLTEIDEYGNSNTETAWMTYNLTEDKLIMVIEENKVFLDYSFSENYTILELTEKNEPSMILKKI